MPAGSQPAVEETYNITSHYIYDSRIYCPAHPAVGLSSKVLPFPGACFLAFRDFVGRGKGVDPDRAFLRLGRGKGVDPDRAFLRLSPHGRPVKKRIGYEPPMKQ
jgi:hypothetical protein